MGRKEKKVPSIFQVVFDDSDFTLAQDSSVSIQQTPTEHQELKNKDDFLAPALKDLPLSMKVGGNVSENSHKTMGQGVQWTTGTQINEEATEGCQQRGFTGKYTVYSRNREEVRRVEKGQECRPFSQS